MPGQKLIEIIRDNAKRTNRNSQLELATILTPLPDISIKIDNMKVVLDKKFLFYFYGATFLENDRIIVSALQNSQKYMILGKVVDANA